MTFADLEEDLKDRLKNIFKEKTFLNSKGELEPLKILTGWIPPSDLEEETYPFAMIRTTEGSDTEEKSSLNFKIYLGFCAFAKNNKAKIEDYREGHRVVLSAIQNIRSSFLKKRALNFGIIEKPLNFKLHEEQDFPFMTGEINISVKVFEIESEEGLYE